MRDEIAGDLITPAFKVTAVGGTQVLVFILLYEAAVEIYVSNVGPMNQILGFGMQMDYGLYLLSILGGIHALTLVLAQGLEYKLISTLACTGIWIAYWGNVADVVPRRFAMLTILGMVSFLTGLILTAKVQRRSLDNREIMSTA